MLQSLTCFILAITLLFAGLSAAQDERRSCALMKGLDLKPLLGADHDAPVPFGKESCRAESSAPGRMVALAVTEQPAAELRNWFATVKKMNAMHRAKEVRIVPEPALGPEAFSVRERGELRAIEIYALKGSRAVALSGTWASGKPIDDSGVKLFQQLARSALDKLP